MRRRRPRGVWGRVLAILVPIAVVLELLNLVVRVGSVFQGPSKASPEVRREVLRSVEVVRRGVLGDSFQVASNLGLTEPCDELTPGLRHALVATLHGFDHGDISSCDVAFPFLGDEILSAKVKREYRTATVAEVLARGDVATVHFHGGLGDFDLRRIDGRWLVDRYPLS